MNGPGAAPDRAVAEAERTLLRARVNLLHEQPFFGVLLMHLQPASRRDLPRRTMSTDGRWLWYDPEFVLGSGSELLKVALVHVVGHLVLEHAARRRGREARRWRVAAEFAVNAVVAEAHPEGRPPLRIPEDWLHSPSFHGWPVERIYEALEAWVDPETSDPEDIETLDACVFDDACEACAAPGGLPWAQRARQAANAARLRGRLPAYFSALLRVDEGRVDWRAVLRDFLLAAGRADYRWVPPNRRYLHLGLVLPSLRGEGGCVAIVVDTSGSMPDSAIAACLGEVKHCMAMQPALEVLLVQCDAEVHSSDLVRDPSVLDLVRVTGRGGTDFRPAFGHVARRAAEEGLDVRALVYMTDMHGEFPERAPPWPVLWARLTDAEPPFGQVVDIGS